ncbi:MAG: G-protein coupled receptor [Hydrococcus sp. Prado102]|nr:G-protein coupled receptor [Hydrococcus sp. Prado102]
MDAYAINVPLKIQVPCVSLVILNAALVRTMIVAEQRRKKLNRRRSTFVSGSTNSDMTSAAIFLTTGEAVIPRRRRRLSDGNATTLMLVAVVGLLLVVEVPLAILLAIVLVENTFQILIISVRSTLLSTIAVNFLVLLSYPLNFFVYCAMSQKFRESFWRAIGLNDTCQRFAGNHVTFRCCRGQDEVLPDDAAGNFRSTRV